jgi:hypothetical protein
MKVITVIEYESGNKSSVITDNTGTYIVRTDGARAIRSGDRTRERHDEYVRAQLGSEPGGRIADRRGNFPPCERLSPTQ